MTLGITRAADRVAIWHEAAEEKKPEPPTSTPPPGVGPPEPPKAGDLAGQDVVVPNTNKFKYPASALNKLLETHPSPEGSVGPPHSSKILSDYLSTPAGQGFSKTYLKPQYQEALKSHLGEQNYTKLLHHMPKEHHQALTTHAQAPAPKSNKFTQPANQLKKLLDNPKTTPAHVQAWQDSHEGFVKSYLHNPSYQQAIKGHLGEQNYDDWQQHLQPGNKPAAPPPVPEQPAAQAPSTSEALHQNLLDAAEAHPDVTGEQMKMFKSPDFQDWFQSKPLISQKKWAQDPTSAVGYFQQDTGHGQEVPPVTPTPPAGKPAVGNEPAAESHPGGNKPAIDKGALNQDLVDIGLPADYLSGLSPVDAEAKLKQNVTNWEGTPLGEKLKGVHTKHFPPWGAQDPTPEGAQEATSPSEVEQHQVLSDAIAKIFPNHALDLDEMNVPEMKAQLENWKTHLTGTPGLESHIQQVEDLYDQHFGQGAMAAPAQPNVPSPAQPPAPSGGIGDQLTALFAGSADALSPDLAQSWNQQGEKNPAMAQEGLKSLIKMFPDHAQDLQQLHDSLEAQPSAPTVQGPEFNDWWQGLHPYEKEYYEKNPQEAQQNFLADSKGPVHDQNLADLADVMGSYQGGSKYLTDVPDYKVWEKSLSKQQAQDFLNDPAAAKQHFEEFLTNYDYSGDVSPEDQDEIAKILNDWWHSGDVSPEDQDEIAKIQQQMGGDPWATKPEPTQMGGGAPGDPATMKADFEKIIPGHKWDFSTPEKVSDFKNTVGDVLDPDYDPTGPDADEYINSPEKVQEIKDFWAKHFGAPAGGAQGGGVGGLNPNLLKKYFPSMPADSVSTWMSGGDLAKQKALIEKNMGNSLMTDEPKAKWQKILDEAFGGETPAGAQTVGEKLKALNPDMLTTAEQIDTKLEGKSSEEAKKLFDSTINKYPDLAEGLQKIYDQHYGGGPPAPPPPPEFDWDQFGSEFKGLFTSSSWADSAHTPEEAEAKLKALVDKSNEQHPDSDKTQQANALYQKWFGGSAPAGGGGLTPDLLKKYINPTHSLMTALMAKTPEQQKAFIQNTIANSPVGPKWQKLYDEAFGGGTPAGGGNQPAQPPPEPEEEEGVSAPAKSQQPTAEELAAVTEKPVSPGDWKDFATWWGMTQLTPEQEQGIYQSWFPGKQVTPEKANGWFQQIYDHYSKPSTGDLTAAGMPAWASASWALGTKAAKEWPVFQQWAAKDAGIPKGTSIKQKLGIWNGLNTADKKEIAENYLPATPVDAKAVVGALAAAFPDSDWSKWAKMPQGTLKTNVEMLAKSGYDEAIPVYNQFFGGTLPVPQAAAAEKGNKPAAPWEPPMVPPSALPDWVKHHWGDSDAEAKKYTDFKHFADSIGAGDLAEHDYQAPMVKMWQQLPTYQQQQITSMPTPPWKDVNEFTAWKDAQPKLIDHLKELFPETDWEKNYYGMAYTFSKPTIGHTGTQQRTELGKLIEAEADPQKKQALLGLYHQFFGNGKTTLSQSLSAIYPTEDWDKFLQGKDTAGAKKELLKRLKKEPDSEKWVQLLDTWTKYFPHPTSNYKVAPPGIKAVTNYMSNTSPGNGMNSNQLKALKYWKEGGDPNADVPWYGSSVLNDYDPGPYIQSKLATKDPGGYPAFHGWTPAGQAAMEGFKADPAMLGSTGPTYTAPAAEAKGKQYESLLATAQKHKADSHAGGGLSAKELGVLKSEEFAHWWSKSSRGYQEAYKTHPGIALDDFREFMGGGAPYGPVPGGPVGTPKQINVNPIGVPQKNKPEGVPSYLTRNRPRSEKVKFPHHEDVQETLPLGGGESFAPAQAPLPLYRLMRLKLDEEPMAPDWVKGGKARENHVQQQKARLRRIDEIVNGKASARKYQDDFQDFKQFAKQYGLDDESRDQLEMELFAPKQGDLFSDDKWAYFADFAKSHNIDPTEMHDLARKMEVSPPLEQKGNYDHPELAQLILDYYENGGGAAASGVGTHWTRDLDKAHHGIPQGGVFGPEKMKSTRRQVPVLMHGLWGGQGETGSSEGGAYEPHDPREVEQNLRSNAPVLIHRLQVRGQEAGGEGAPWGKHREDWHDVMDHLPASLLPPGPNETVSETSHGSGAPSRLVLDKPSLAQALQDSLGGGATKNESSWNYAKKDWDHLKPGHQADIAFNKLVGALGPHPEQTHPKELARIRRIYEEFFVGKPEMPVKPHVRRASLDADTAELCLILRMARFSDAEYRQHVTALDNALNDHFARKRDTRHTHAITGADGVARWSPTRLRQQKRAVDRAWAELGGDDIPREGRAMLLGGVPGSGKGDLYRHPLLGLQNYLRIDPDHMKHVMAKEGMIPAIPGHSPMESSPLAHQEASELATRLAERAYRQGRNVVWDTTLSNHRATTDTIKRLRQSGYHTVDAALMDTDPRTARTRAEQRHRVDEEDFRDGIGEGGGGRWVPSGVSNRNMAPSPGSGYRSRPLEVFHGIRSKVDNAAIFNGDTTPEATLTRATGPTWGQPTPTPAPTPALTTTGATAGHTVRSLLDSHERGELPFEHLVPALATASYTVKPEARDLAEHYHQAAEHPDDNDFFWVNSAHDRGVLNDTQHQQITAAIDAHHRGQRQSSLAVLEARIMRLAGIDDLPGHMRIPHWLADYDSYGQVPGEVGDHWKDFLNRLDDDGIEKYSDPEKYSAEADPQNYSDDFEESWSDFLEARGVKPNWDYDEEDDEEDEDYDDDAWGYDEDDDEDGGDFEGDPPEPTIDRPAGWSTPAPWTKDPRGRQYFPPGGLNPPSSSHARPDLDWEEAEHEQAPLPMSSDESHLQTWDEWPHDVEPTPLYRGFALRLDRDKDRGDPFGQLRRSLWGGQYESGEDSPTGNKANARPHPLGFDNPGIGSHILDLLQTNKIKPNSKNVDLGRHWTTNENTAHSFALEGTGQGSEPLYLPVKIRAQWKGLGEDPYRSNTAGHWPEEHEITMTKGAPMHIDSVQIRHPHTGDWHEVLDAPTQRAASVVRKPRGILTMRERLGI